MGKGSSTSQSAQEQNQVGVQGGVGLGKGASDNVITITTTDRETVDAALGFGALALTGNERVATEAIRDVSKLSGDTVNKVVESANRTQSVAENAVIGAQQASNAAVQTALNNPNAAPLSAYTGQPGPFDTKTLLIIGALVVGVAIIVIMGRKT